ncbi:FLJ37770-like protein [Trichonephila clavipes]|nr:FLJ37770-like protein [Trichonephila clavipes]
MEKRAVTKFYAKLGKSDSETSNVFSWLKQFLDIRYMVKDDQCSGRPISSRTPEIIEEVRNFEAIDGCAPLKMMVDSVNINKEAIQTTLLENVGRTKVSVKFAPHTLFPGQKAMRRAHCKRRHFNR